MTTAPVAKPQEDPEDPHLQGQAITIKAATSAGRDLWVGLEEGKTVRDLIVHDSPEPAAKTSAKKALSLAGLYKTANQFLEASAREFTPGIHFHPFDFEAALAMREVSSHHGSCMDTIVALSVGLGFKDPKIAQYLNPMTVKGIQWELVSMAKHLVATGQGYLEVQRTNGTPSALYSHPSKNMLIVQDGPSFRDRHFLFTPLAGRFGYDCGDTFDTISGDSQASFAPYGRREELASKFGFADFLSNLGNTGVNLELVTQASQIGEVIDFAQPTEMWEVYGGPAWIGANAYLELGRCHLGRTHLYMQNRGAPDSILFMYGTMLNDEQKKALTNTLNAGQGDGYGKSVALTFPGVSQQSGKAHVERFGDQIDGTTFQEIHDTTALAICSAHRIPPILAGISTARSMGASAEMTQALVLTQMTVITPLQNLIQERLACTLGGPDGIPELRGNKFELNKITDMEDIQALNVMARSRQQDTSMTRSTESSPSLKR